MAQRPQFPMRDQRPRDAMTWREGVLLLAIVVAGLGWLSEAANVQEREASPHLSTFIPNYDAEEAWLKAMDQAGVKTLVVSSAEDMVELPDLQWKSRQFVVETPGTKINDLMPYQFEDKLTEALKLHFADKPGYIGPGGFRFSGPNDRVHGVIAEQAGAQIQFFFHFVRQSDNRATIICEAREFPR